MKICFFAPASELSESLRRCVEEAFGSPVINLADAPIERWKENVAGADLIVVDVTAQNASACYLMGLGDALGKQTIILSPIRDSIPQIFADRHSIVHQWNLELIQGELRKFAKSGATVNDPPAPSDDTPAGRFQRVFGDLLKSHGYVHRGAVEWDGSTFTLREQEMDLPLVQAIANRAKSLNVRVRLL